jgi:hypothetical protein
MNNCVVFCLVHKKESKKKGKPEWEKAAKTESSGVGETKSKKKEAAKNINL